MIKARGVVGIAFALAMALPSVPSLAVESLVGTLKAVKGDFVVIHHGKETKAVSGIKITEKDQILTGKDGWATLSASIFSVQVAPHSIFHADLSFNDDHPAIVTLVYGHVFVEATKPGAGIKNQDRLRVRTPGFVLGIKGTAFLVHVTRREQEFIDRFELKKIPERPKVGALRDMKIFPELYSRVDCLDGALVALAEGAEQSQAVATGQGFETSGSNEPKAKLLKIGIDEINLIKNGLAFTAKR